MCKFILLLAECGAVYYTVGIQKYMLFLFKLFLNYVNACYFQVYIYFYTYIHTQIYICVLLLKLHVFLVDFQYQSQNFIRYFFHPLLPPPYVFVCKIFCIFILVCSSCILHVAFQRCFSVQCSIRMCIFNRFLYFLTTFSDAQSYSRAVLGLHIVL